MARSMTFTRKRLSRLLHDRKGSVALMAGFAMAVLVGFVGLGTEVGYWYVKKRDLQGAADSAAFAAATSLMNGDTKAQGTNAGLAIAQQYGFTAGTIGGVVTSVAINNPPLSGTHTADNNAFEVVVSQTQPRLFTALLMSSDPTILGRAVATQLSDNAPSCIIALDKTKVDTDFGESGNANVNMPNCNVYINSADDQALSISGSSTYTSNATYVAGGIYQGGSSTVQTEEHEYTGQTYDDPYAGTTMPTPGGCDGTNTNIKIQPGADPNAVVEVTNPTGVRTFCAGLQFTANTKVKLDPGTYIIKGTSGSLNLNQFQVGANVSLTGTGVTIVLTGSGSTATTWASVNIDGTADVQLTAPKPGDSTGMPPFAFYQDPNTPTGSVVNTFNGDSVVDIQGALYFPKQVVKMTGNTNTGTGTSKCTQIVAYQVKFSGNAGYTSDAANCSTVGIKSVSGGGGGGGNGVALVE